ncbi:hypothetical protein WMY93_018673 [Mugilogobius chulae]|uniref:Rho-GAP domain-containing protein n=1 Tax=Mugilogobius chulae TaxID=88201 RepID=A0AAW0NR24_9GOBI
MGASASVSLCSDPSSVKVLRSTAKVSPEPVVSALTDPESRPSCVFGVALETLRKDGQVVGGVPAVLKDMVEYLNKNGLQHRGLFRLCGSVVRMRILRQRWDGGERIDLQNDGDVPTVASLLKLFFRELPVPVVPEMHRKQFIHSLKGNADDSLTNQSLKENLQQLPSDNLLILSYLINFLSGVATLSHSNHMPMENLATIFGPCIFHVPAGPRMIEDQSVCNALLLHFLKHHSVLFPNQPEEQLISDAECSSTPPPPLSAFSQIQRANECKIVRSTGSVIRFRRTSTFRKRVMSRVKKKVWELKVKIKNIILYILRSASRGGRMRTLSLLNRSLLCCYFRTNIFIHTKQEFQDTENEYFCNQVLDFKIFPLLASEKFVFNVLLLIGPTYPTKPCHSPVRVRAKLESKCANAQRLLRKCINVSLLHYCGVIRVGDSPLACLAAKIYFKDGVNNFFSLIFCKITSSNHLTTLRICFATLQRGSADSGSDCLDVDCRGRNSCDGPSLKLQALDSDFGLSTSPADLKTPEGLPAQHQPATCDEKNLCLNMLLQSTPTKDKNNAANSAQSENSMSPSSSESSSLCADTFPEKKSSSAAVTSPLLSRITTSDCPVPSPRCPSISHSLRFNLDPDTAPSPPCSQEVRMARSNVRAQTEEQDSSVSMLNRHIHYLRKRIRRFEELFEQERHYKPAHNDKTANPEVARLMKELIKCRKQLKELKLKQSIKGQGDANPLHQSCKAGHDHRGSALAGLELQLLNNNDNTKPNVERRPMSSQQTEGKEERAGPADSLKEMSQFQIALEKTCLQKCLLYYESLQGDRQERTLMKPFYDRYRVVKQLQNSSSASTVITTINEEDGSDEESPKPCSPRPLPHWIKPQSFSSDKSSLLMETCETPLVSPLDEAHQPQLVTMATLHEASRPELLDHLRTARSEKRRLHNALREFEDHFYSQTGRACQKEDRGPMAEEYCQYKNLKAKLRLLEALLSKHHDSTSS